jgi:murein DD-endopeptidase MepM/ murein hydrolase activator NlpD
MSKVPGIRVLVFLIALLVSSSWIPGCATAPRSPAPEVPVRQEPPTPPAKEVRLPFRAGTRFRVSQGPFGKASHSEKGNEYQWDFDVPYGTRVISVEAGQVIEVWAPRRGGGCDPRHSANAHNIKIRHSDGSVAQYVHVAARVKAGENVREGEWIAVTAKNGWICQPQLHFGIYRDEKKLYSSPERESIPLRFRALPDGAAPEGLEIETPKL